jgi:EAL domain-containing protein (putative c-di-GMP-specific phosphodiesterase class I)
MAFMRQTEKLNILIIAGFVENAGCLQVLWNSGVHYIQGNFLQEPDETLGFDFG